MAKNAHKVPSKMWAKWSRGQQAMFNRTFATLEANRVCIGFPQMDAKTWRAVRWNAAWMVADDCAASTIPDGRPVADLMEAALGLIGNVSGGDWKRQSPEWQKAARRWVKRYYTANKRGGILRF